AGQITYTAEVDGSVITSTVTVTFTAGEADIENSTIISDKSVVRADGIQTATIFVTLKDAWGNPVANQNVELIQTAGTSTIATSRDMTDHNGVAQFTVANTKMETVQYEAKIVATNQMLKDYTEVTFAGVSISTK